MTDSIPLATPYAVTDALLTLAGGDIEAVRRAVLATRARYSQQDSAFAEIREMLARDVRHLDEVLDLLADPDDPEHGRERAWFHHTRQVWCGYCRSWVRLAGEVIEVHPGPRAVCASSLDMI